MLMNFCEILLYVLSGTSVFVAILNKKFEEVLPIFFMLVIVILYMFGLFGFLKFSMTTIKNYCTLGFIFSLYVAKNSYINFLKNMFSQSFVVYIFIVSVAFYFLEGKNTYNWDELNHWAFFSRSIYENNKLLYDVNFTNFSYPPTSNLVHYFGLNLINKFSTPFLFIIKSMFILSFVFIRFDNLSYINKLLSILFIFVLYFINIPYLLVDIDIAVIFAYGCLLVFTMNKPISFYDLIHLCLVIFILTLIKSSAIFFSLSLVAILVLNIKFNNIKYSFGKKYLYFVSMLPALIYFSWKIYRSISISGMWYIEKQYGSHFLPIANIDRVLLFFKYFFYNNLFFYPIDRIFRAIADFSLSFFYSPGFYLVLLSIIYYFVYIKNQNNKFIKASLKLNYFIFLSIVISYMILHIILYLTVLGIESGGGPYPSLSRYFSSLIYGYFYISFFMMLIFNVLKNSYLKVTVLFALLFMVFLNFSQLYKIKQNSKNIANNNIMIPSFAYKLPRHSVVCLSLGNNTTKKILDVYEFFLARINSLGYINLTNNHIKCDYYFINIDDKEQYKFISNDIKLGDLYKVVDKNKNIYEYILNDNFKDSK